MGNGRYIVCFADEEKHNPMVVGPLLEKYADLPRSEARRAVAKGHGLLADGLPEERAEGLLKALRDQGLDAFAVAESAAPRIENIQPLHGVSLEPRAIVIQIDKLGSKAQVPYEAVAACACTQTIVRGRATTHTYTELAMAPGGPATRVHRRERKEPEQPGPVVTMALRNKHGDVRAFEFNEKRVDYQVLGDRMDPFQAVNFGLFFQELARRVPDAFLTEGYRGMMQGNRARVTRVAGPDERIRQLRWALACARHEQNG